MPLQPATASLPAEMHARGLSLTQLFAILHAYRWALLAAAVIGAVVAGLVSKLVLKKSYDAVATVLVDYDVASPEASREFPSQLAVGYMKTQVAFVGSAAVLGPALDALGWMSSPEKRKGYSGPDSGLREHLLWKVLSPNLSIVNPQDSRFIFIGYSGESAEESAKVANTIAEIYVREHGELRRSPARERATEYQESLDELKARFVASQVAVAEFRQRTGLVDLEGRSSLDEERLRDLNSALLAAESSQRETATRNQQVSRLGRSASDSDVEFAASPGVVGIRADLLEAETRFTELRKRLGPRHPEYVAAESRVRQLQDMLSREVSGFGGGLMDNAATAIGQSSAQVGELKARIADEQQRLLEVRGLQDEVSRLLSERDAAEKVYKLALDQYGQVIRSAESAYNDVSLVSSAMPPARHTKPSTMVNALVGLVGGLVCSALVCLVIELRRRRVRCEEDLEAAFPGVPVLVIGSKPA